MSASAAGRFEEIARTARRVQDGIERVRGTAAAAGIRIEVAADGRITALELADPVLAQSISAAHNEALRQAADQVVNLRRELVTDPTIAAALHHFIEIEAESAERTQPHPPTQRPARPAPRHPRQLPGEDLDLTDENPHALPPHIRRRYGL
ncbi:YbaB/EbfC family nucleoid-associated protein [Nocardia otitidiscaviarum]|uniref:YbaB/EbfC family nucleoid-associated protein n=1 Tax=Nocardia otitidiscaviarum TaxID=1823 RepID=A0A516NT60_9NOCA|nr:YbaB/EbfC family nucleoid-associated protein [Nocardia otitidiscaviarum]MBF6179258.1 hypothetical protein [Nocardia otitidiscaviarum]MCP9621394.1 hypothetical protein [Nocardia otitidiscaviarum]QDP82098.1 hypothetical protein FOH10_28580 [Nocardia otitidiscaviarum]